MEQIDYKEKYEQALAKAKELAIDGYLDAVAVNDIFPEFADSENEKIRKELLDYCKNKAEIYPNDPKYKNISAWISWLKRQGEQKPVEWAKEDIQMYRNILFYLSEPSPLKEVNGKSREQLLDWFKALKYRVQPQPKQEWSEEDENLLNRCIINTQMVDSDDTLKIWLKSLKERVQPQPKQDWSQNDIDMIDWLIRCCEKEHEELCNEKYGHQDIVSDLKRDCRKKWDWLESLKNRVAHQKQWKPSDGQMEKLELTWEDVDRILDLYAQVPQYKEGNLMEKKDVYEEILRRFNEQKYTSKNIQKKLKG